MNDWKLVPTKLTAENGMKAALMGEFHVPFPERDEDGNEHIRKVNVPWTVIKKIHEAVIAATPEVVDSFLKQAPSTIPTTDEHNALLVEEIEELRETLHSQEARGKAVDVKHSKELKKHKKDSLQFVGHVYQFINWLDAEMKKPSDEGRGKRIAHALNALEMCTDGYSHFTLDQSFAAISKLKGKKS